MRRAARSALVAPLIVVSGVLFTAFGSVTVLAAGPSAAATTKAPAAVVATPETSSKPHKHAYVECHPAKVSENHGQCAVKFVDEPTKSMPSPVGETVCFGVSPRKAGAVGTGNGNCAKVSKKYTALGTFTASGNYCGIAVIVASIGPRGQWSRHTDVTITCKKKAATETAAYLPAGSPFPPAGGWLIAAMGVAVALLTASALRLRRLSVPRRLGARQPA